MANYQEARVKLINILLILNAFVKWCCLCQEKIDFYKK